MIDKGGYEMKKVFLIAVAVMAIVMPYYTSTPQLSAQATNPNSGRVLVFIPKTTNSQFWVAIWDGAKKAAKELGYKNVLFQGVASGSDVVGQLNLLNDVVTSKPAGILLAAIDSKSLKDPVEKAIAFGVPVVTVNSGVGSDKVKIHVATDNYSAAASAAEALAELMGKQGLVADIGIDAGSQTGRERENGFRETMTKQYPGIKVLPVQYAQGDVSKAMNTISDLLTGNPAISGIYCAQDAAGTGVAQLMKQRGVAAKAKIKVIAFDASPDEFLLFLDGFIDGMIVQDPFSQGYMGVYAIDAVINGKPIEKNFIATPTKLITLQNMTDPDIYDLLANNTVIKQVMDSKGIKRK
jgi:ribose transport system substrate-binding protein